CSLLEQCYFFSWCSSLFTKLDRVRRNEFEPEPYDFNTDTTRAPDLLRAALLIITSRCRQGKGEVTAKGGNSVGVFVSIVTDVRGKEQDDISSLVSARSSVRRLSWLPGE
ncbi:hypothetical protein BaRGS_00004380, partial [Batillaria attramentaria]